MKLSPATTAAYVVVVTAAVVTAVVLGPVVWDVTASAGGDREHVAVVTLRGGTTDANVAAVTQRLRQIRGNDSVAAVVLRIDSPGGPVDASEEFYLAVNRTASEMPVVAYVEGTAASGGYFGISPADEIVVKPSSNVGSIGVIVQAPRSAIEDTARQQEQFVRSGPDKAQISIDSLRQDIETLQRAFVGTVLRHRGDELTLSRSEVASGRTYLGTRAVQNGFADRIGDVGTAIERAAALSPDIEGDQYDVVYADTQRPVQVFVLGGSVERVEGDVVYVDRPDDTREQEFQRPVEYYAVWGVPAGNASDGEVYVYD
ncbi:S49 family peptidase [Halomicroarcula sp. F13]|uniref:S49 family peptidase n=1 Tax=Haloarcula rubra TaxID=2487747 RepID=A0AAW4PZP6_9EURY|nr:S49 family peptidase [Halomicroarcula rubra]MBX0325693.1 S49 family peptidase [Halomicroarcula rubra]